MKTLVVGSCGKKKRSTSSHAPKCKDLTSKESLTKWNAKLSELVHPVRDMYIGNQTRSLVKGVDILREIKGVKVDFYILSAGFGILHENDMIPPYDCSFIGMRKGDIRARSEALSIPKDFLALTKQHYDLAYLALGQKYMLALDEEWQEHMDCTTIIFGKQSQREQIFTLPANKEIVVAYSQSGYKIHGIAGFKGDLFRILALHAQHEKEPYKAVVNWSQGHKLLNLIYTLGNLKAPSHIIQTSINTGSS